MPNLDVGWVDPVASVPNYEPAIESHEAGPSCLDLPNTCDELESEPLKDVILALYPVRVIFKSDFDIPIEPCLDSSDPIPTPNLESRSEPIWDDHEAQCDENQILDLNYDFGQIFHDYTSPDSSKERIDF